MLFYATQSQYVDHLAPIAAAMDHDGFYVQGRAAARARQHGLDPIVAMPPPNVPALVAGWSDERQLSNRNPLAFLEHGTGQQYHGVDASSRTPGSRPHVGLYLATNAMVAGRMKPRFPNARLAVVGAPKLDRYVTRPDADNRVVLGWHWSPSSPPEARSAWTHYRNYLGVWAETVTPLYGHGHPRTMSMHARHYQKTGIPILQHFDQVLETADIYACDNSSTIFEAAAVGIKVILFNAPWYRRDVHHGLRFWEWADIGPNVNHPEEFEAAVEALRTDDIWGLRRRHVREQLYPYFGKSTSRAVAALRSWARETPGQ